MKNLCLNDLIYSFSSDRIFDGKTTQKMEKERGFLNIRIEKERE